MATETPHRAPEQDDLQALIEEARQRARRRRRRQAVVVLGVALVAAAAYAALVPRRSSSHLRRRQDTAVRAAPRQLALGCVQSVGSLAALTFPDSRIGWVVGSPASPDSAASPIAILRTTDGGDSWSCQWQANLVATQIVATGPQNAWLLAWQGKGCADPATSQACRSVIAGTTDGRHWHVLSRPLQRFTQIAFSSARVGVAAARAGACGEVHGLPPRRCPGAVMLTGDGGRRWHAALHTPGPIVAVSDYGGAIWAVETRLGLNSRPRARRKPGLTILVSRDHGSTWARVGSIDLWLAGPREQVQLLRGRSGALWLSVFDPDGCAMHGCSPDDVYAGDATGEHWRLADPRDVQDDFPGSGCGLAGPIELARDPAGQVWATETIPLATCSEPATVLFRTATAKGRNPTPTWTVSHRWAAFEPSAEAWPTDTVGLALGSAGLTRTTDAGRHWTQVLPAPSPSGSLEATGALTAYGVQDATDQGLLVATRDGGRQWQALADLSGMLVDVDFPSPRTGFAAGAAWVPKLGPRWKLYRTAGSPTSWRALANLPLRGNQQVAGLWMAGPRSGLLLSSSGFIWPQLPREGVGPVALWQTRDGGRTWTKLRRLPVTRSRVFTGASFTPAGPTRWDGWLLIAPDELEATTDTGRTWRVLPATPALDGIDRVTSDFGVAWNGPNNGRVELWQTSDGGTRWQALPLPRGLRQGRISNQQPVYASFASPTAGWLLADGSVWRTTDAGRSWRATQPTIGG